MADVIAEALTRVTEAVETREAGVQKNARRDREKTWTERDYADERQWAKVPYLRLDDMQTLLALIRRQRSALEQWKCGSCGGSGIYLNKWRDGGPEGSTLHTQEVTCTVCAGTGQHPVARAALTEADTMEARG